MGMSCPQSAEECCNQSKIGFESWFCEALCVLCCCQLTVTKGPPNTINGVGEPNPATPKPAGGRDYPVVTTTDGIEYTSSEYGKFIPIVFGSDRLTGNVFWSSKFEQKTFISGEETLYYNTVSFAIALCEGEISAVLRMWVGDKLVIDNSAKVNAGGVIQPNSDGFLSGATIDNLSADSPFAGLADADRATRVSVFTGSEHQIPEGVMAEKEGYNLTPAYRGVAYVLFENFIVDTKSVPTIFVEVLSNTTDLHPRLYFDFQAPKTAFDTLSPSLLTYDPHYDQFLVRAYDLTGTGTPANGDGFVVIDGNTLTEIAELEVVKTAPVQATDWEQALNTITSHGHLLSAVGNGNQGILRVINTITGTVDSVLGPAGGLGGNNTNIDLGPVGFGAPQSICVLTAPGKSGVPTDVYCVVGNSNRSVGFGEINKNNQLSIVSTLNGVLTRAVSRAIPYILDDTFVQKHPTFADGGATDGDHVFVFSHDSGETANFVIQRFQISGTNGTIRNPFASGETLLDLDELSGKGFTAGISDILIDPIDACFILFVTTVGKPSLIVKYNPFTNTIVWTAPVQFFTTPRQAAPGHLFVSEKIAFFSTAFEVYTLETNTGILTKVMTSLGTQALPFPVPGNTFYNGYENSLTYESDTVGKRLTKVFLERSAHANVGIANIITQLLQRVGLKDTDIDVLDLQALSLDGYTIDSKRSLRTVFDELAQVFRFDVVESNGRLLYKTRGQPSQATIPQTHLKDEANGWFQETRVDDFGLARKINLTYRDIDREYGTNVQSVNLPKYDSTQFDGDAAIDVSVPLVLTANKAKSLAEVLLYSKIVYSSQFEATMPPQYMHLDPADVVSFDMGGTDPVVARLRDVTIGADRSVKITASREDPSIYNDTVNLFGNVGRFGGDSITATQPRVDPWLLQIPYRSESEAAAPAASYLMFFTLLNTRIGAKIVDKVTVTVNGTDERLTFNAPTTYPTWGVVNTPLQAKSSLFSTDKTSTLDVTIVNVGPAGLPASAADYLAILNDQKINFAAVGNELIQFETVEHISGNKYRLTNINRCLFGTDAQIGVHQSGEKFILLGSSAGVVDTTSLVPLELKTGTSPRKVIQTFINSTNPFQTHPMEFYRADNLRPAPINDPRYTWETGGLSVTWQYRARYGANEWTDGSDYVPHTETVESYDAYVFKDFLTFSPRDPSTYLRKITTTSPSFIYSNADILNDGFDRYNDNVYVIITSTGSVTGNDVSMTKGLKVFHD